jgi:hypothetical protein
VRVKARVSTVSATQAATITVAVVAPRTVAAGRSIARRRGDSYVDTDGLVPEGLLEVERVSQ